MHLQLLNVISVVYLISMEQLFNNLHEDIVQIFKVIKKIPASTRSIVLTYSNQYRRLNINRLINTFTTIRTQISKNQILTTCSSGNESFFFFFFFILIGILCDCAISLTHSKF